MTHKALIWDAAHGVHVSLCVCVRAYPGVEALCILGDSVELWETEHVLLTAGSVKYAQGEGRQRRKYLHHIQITQDH